MITGYHDRSGAGRAGEPSLVDGQPLAVASEPNPSPELAAGVHTLSVQVDPKALPEIIRVEADGANFLGN